jgi:Flp pilus assembly protein TadD
METRDLLLLIGFLRGGKMFPVAVPQRALPADRALWVLHDAIVEQERTLFPVPPAPHPGPGRARMPSVPNLAVISPAKEDVRRRSAVTDWCGDPLQWTGRVGEVPDPGVVLCLMYDGPAADAALPVDVFAQTLRRFALRDLGMRARFDAHVALAGTFVPPWLSPEVRRQRSQEAFDRAVQHARQVGFAAAAPLFEGVRGECYAPAQVALALHELGELGDTEGALGRLDEVLRVAPRNVAARMARAQILAADAGRRVEAAADWLAVLREVGDPGASPPRALDEAESPRSKASPETRAEAREGLWELCREFANPRKLEAAAALVQQDPERGFEAVSRYVHTHPCSWDAHLLLASVALSRQSFELTVKLLAEVRWLYPDQPNPHFVYGQALASKGQIEAAVPALSYAARLSPTDADISRWLSFARAKLPGTIAEPSSVGVEMAYHVVRTLLLVVGFVRDGRVHPAALPLHRVPGDVSLALVVQALAGQERRRFGGHDGRHPQDPEVTAAEPPPSGQPSPADVEVDLAAAAARVVLFDQQGALLHAEQLVGDVPDPGVVLALLYESMPRDGSGRPAPVPSTAECHRTLTSLARADTEIAGKLARHLESPDASLMGRLHLRE